MKVLVAGPRGFCAGVDMAVRALNRLLERFAPPVYCYHEVVHNEAVVADFQQRGTVFVDSVQEVPPGAVLAVSAHGISPQIRDAAARRGLHVVDLTCPLVAKVHREAKSFAAQGRTIALIGHSNHDEILGVLGEAPANIVLIENIEHARAINSDCHRGLAYLTQTTLSVDDTRNIIEELKSRCPDIVGPAIEDICYATQNRQEAIRQLARESDVALVIGSQNSSNTCNLVATAVREGKPAHRIANASEIQSAWLDGVEVIALTSGASVPESLVAGVIQFFQESYAAEVEERIIRNEATYFPLPAGL